MIMDSSEMEKRCTKVCFYPRHYGELTGWGRVGVGVVLGWGGGALEQDVAVQTP